MGLFGGFKAKFTKDSTAKSASKSSKKNTVVCVGYRVYSEFQDPPQYLQQEPTVRRRPSAIKTVLRPESTKVGKEINHPGASTSPPIKTHIITNVKAKKSSIRKAPTVPARESSVATVTNAIKHDPTPRTPPREFSRVNNATNAIKHDPIPMTPPREFRVATATNAIKHDATLTTPERESNVVTVTRVIKQDVTKSDKKIHKRSYEKIPAIELRKDKPNGDVRSAPNSTYVVGKTSSFNPTSNVSTTFTNDNDRLNAQNKEPPKSILKSKSLGELSQSNNHVSENNHIIVTNHGHYSDSEDEESQDRTLTLSSKTTSDNNGYKTETVDYLTATESATRNHTTQVSTYVRTEVSSSDSDNTIESKALDSYYSGGYGNSQSTRNIGGTSSYAANIFFGGDEEPEVQRPRRVVNMSSQQKQDESRSSAEC